MDESSPRASRQLLIPALVLCLVALSIGLLLRVRSGPVPIPSAPVATIQPAAPPQPAPDVAAPEVRDGEVLVTIPMPPEDWLTVPTPADGSRQVDIVGSDGDTRTRLATGRLCASHEPFGDALPTEAIQALTQDIEQLESERMKALGYLPPPAPDTLRVKFDDPLAAKKAERAQYEEVQAGTADLAAVRRLRAETRDPALARLYDGWRDDRMRALVALRRRQLDPAEETWCFGAANREGVKPAGTYQRYGQDNPVLLEEEVRRLKDQRQAVLLLQPPPTAETLAHTYDAPIAALEQQINALRARTADYAVTVAVPAQTAEAIDLWRRQGRILIVPAGD